jgi:hypothetical protein
LRLIVQPIPQTLLGSGLVRHVIGPDYDVEENRAYADIYAHGDHMSITFFLRCAHDSVYDHVITMKAKKDTTNDGDDGFKSGPNIARIIDVDPATVRRYKREGMPNHKVGPGLVRYKLSEVLAWRAQRKSKKEATA